MHIWKNIRFFWFWLALCLPVDASAHQQDEYLQTASISIGTNQIQIELTITPGINLAELAYNQIDNDRNKKISPYEQQRYTQTLLTDLTLEYDGKQLPLIIEKIDFPSLVAMSMGMGHIKIWLSATITNAESGTHKLFFQNVHRPMQSVYLLNALAPTDKAITITNQTRDKSQYNITLTYNQLGAFSGLRNWGWFAGLGMFVLGWWLLWKRNQ
jgi:hypothetical protein